MKQYDPAWDLDFADAPVGGTLTVCFCWIIERVTDGKIFYFTDHDRPVEFMGNTYEITTGFNRSALKSTGDLAAESTSVAGIFDSSQITKQDLVKNLFDSAKVWIFVIDYLDIPKGPINVAYGRFGAITQTSNNTFQCEFRDLTQLMNEPIGESRTPLCRADFGDDRCNNCDPGLPPSMKNPTPVNVEERLDLHTYAEGDVVKVKTGPDPATFNSNIVNPDFETGDLTGWTVGNGQWQVLTSHVSMTPHSGNFLLRAGPSEPGDLDQFLDFRNLLEFSTPNVDAGLVDVQFSIYRGQPDQAFDDPGRVRLFALDSSLTPMQPPIYDTLDEVISPNDTWVERGGTFLLPVGAVGVLVTLRTPNVVQNADALFDDLSLIILDRAQAAGSSSAYEDRAYRCTVPGESAAAPPVFDTTVGNPTVDGTVTWVAEESYMVAGEVRSAFGNTNFSIPESLLTDPLYDSPWFQNGLLVWETGANADLATEVQEADPPTFELKWPAPYPMEPGDRFRVAPGCNFKLATCGDKFNRTPPTNSARGNRDNMRAEPHLAGLKAFLQRAKAKE